MRHPIINSAFARLPCLLGFVTELVLQNLAKQEKSSATKHPLREKVSGDSTRDNVCRNDRLIFFLFHGCERAEDENKESD
jgi:hypothetical protein